MVNPVQVATECLSSLYVRPFCNVEQGFQLRSSDLWSALSHVATGEGYLTQTRPEPRHKTKNGGHASASCQCYCSSIWLIWPCSARPNSSATWERDRSGAHTMTRGPAGLPCSSSGSYLRLAVRLARSLPSGRVACLQGQQQDESIERKQTLFHQKPYRDLAIATRLAPFRFRQCLAVRHNTIG